MLRVLFWLLSMIPVVLAVHEFSHWFVARRLGVPMSWRFSWGELRIPRGGAPAGLPLWHNEEHLHDDAFVERGAMG